MGAVRTVWVGYDEYVFALKTLQALFRTGQPDAARLRRILERERTLRGVLEELGDQERADLALDHGFEPAWFQAEAVELARAGFEAEATALVEIADALFPAEAGISWQIVRAQTGRLDEATAELERLVANGEQRRYPRLCALEALHDIGALDSFLRAGFTLAQEYARAQDFESAWCAVNAVDVALLGIVEESQSRWRGEAQGKPPLRH